MAKIKETTLRNTLRSTAVIIFAGLMCLFGWTSQFLPPNLGISLQTFLAVLAATLLGGLHGTSAVGIWFMAGAAGLPVLCNGTSGIKEVTGPYSGYIWSFFILSFIVGLLLGTPHLFEKKFNAKVWLSILLLTLTSYILIDAAGLLSYRWSILSDPTSPMYSSLSHMTESEVWKYAFTQTVLYSLPYGIVLCIISISISGSLRAYVAKLLYPSDEVMEDELIESIKHRQEIVERLLGKNKNNLKP